MNRLKPQLSTTDQYEQSKSETVSSQGSNESGLDSSRHWSFTNPTTSPLTRFNLKKYDEKQEHHLDGRNTDPRHHQRQIDNLKNALSGIGLELSNDLIARMMPASIGESPMKSFLSEKNDQTMQEKVYSRKLSSQGQEQNLQGKRTSSNSDLE